MSNNIEDQIVSMQFDNKQFESGVATSLGTIDKLKGSLAFPDAGKGLDSVNAAARGFNLGPMSGALDGVSKKWLAMTTVAVTAISNITNKVIDAGLQLGKSLAIDPITQGFKEYETNLNSVQTIMSNTGADVNTVNKYLNNLNHYSDKTIYNFGEMAKNIGTFTAAGVDLKTSTESIKGIANLAALSGSNSQQASTAMYQLSQAIAAGKVGLQDWNSVVNAGIGGKKFQQALADTAVAMGTLDKSQVKLSGQMKNVTIDGNAFRNSLTPPPGGGTTWLTSGVLTSTLQQFTGDMTDAKLASMGFSKEQIKNIQALAKTSQQAATRIKTVTQLVDVVKESIGSGWAKIFQDLFGNFKEASTLWTGVGNTIVGTISHIFGSIDKMLLGWRKLGGYQDLWATFGNVFKVLGNLIHPVIVLFQAITPNTGKAGSGLAKFTGFLADFTGFLVKLTNPLGNFTVNLSFMGKLFKIVGTSVGAFVSALKPLLPILDQIGNYVGDLFNQGMEIAGNLIAGWTEGLDPQMLKDAAIELANSWITWIKDALGIHSPATTMIPIGLNIMQGILEGLKAGASLLIKGLQAIFVGLGKTFKYLVENISWNDVLDTINTGLFLGLVLLFRKFVTAFTGTIGQFQQIMGKAGGVLDQMTSNLKAMQQKVKSEVIRNIAISVVLLAGAAFLLASIDTKKLGIALGAIGGLMAGLVGAMKVVAGGKGTRGMDAKQIAKQSGMLLALGTAMIAFSTAILILTGAVAIMGQLDPKTIEKGLAGITGVIALITTATAILSKTGGGATILATATALLIMSAALVAFVGVMKLYEKLNWKTLVRGGGAAAAVIFAVGLAMRAFGKGAIGGSVGLVIASAALVVLANALTVLASIGLGDMVKAVLALVVVLTALSAAALVMSAAEGGAGSMMVMALAIIVLASALKIISGISLGNLVKALVFLALALGLIAAAAVLLTPAVPLIAALGSALLLLGLAVLAAGVGVLAFATGLGILAVVGPAAFQAIHDGIQQLLDILPQVGEAMALMVVAFLTGLVKAAGPLAKALGKLAEIILDILIDLIPKVGKLIQRLVRTILNIIVANQVNAAKAFVKFILGILRTLENYVPKMIEAGSNLIISVVEGLGRNGQRIANATGKAILDFLHGIHKAVLKYEEPIIDEGVAIAVDIAKGLVKGFGGDKVIGMVKSAASALADKLPGWMKKVLGISSPSKVMRDDVGRWVAVGVAEGITKHTKAVEDSSTDMANKSLDAMKAVYKNSKRAGEGLIDLQPKITPVLDLTHLEKGATQIGAAMGDHRISPEFSRRRARDIASSETLRRQHEHDGAEGDTYNFNQIINSPKPVNHVKVYRGTKSQIALLKEVKGK
jgi:tape measure domain-containing protein